MQLCRVTKAGGQVAQELKGEHVLVKASGVDTLNQLTNDALEPSLMEVQDDVQDANS
jgi:hypothetical protein